VWEFHARGLSPQASYLFTPFPSHATWFRASRATVICFENAFRSGVTMSPILLRAICGLAFTILSAPTLAQGITPFDSSEALHFARVTREAKKAGYADPVVVGRGSGEMNTLFAVLATSKQTGVLLAMHSPGKGAASIAELERGSSPTDLGVTDVRFLRFLDSASLVDAAVLHEPQMLESSRRFETHHLLRRKGKALSTCCEFAGNATSSSAKNGQSVGTSSRIAIEKIASGPTLQFRITTVDLSLLQDPGVDTMRTVSRNETIKTYELPVTGPCREQ
jgi:hypothetical protein